MSCNFPVIRTDKYGRVRNCPCKRCLGCRNDRREEFTQRLQLELKTYNYVGSFITLTYRKEDCPQLLPIGSAISGEQFKDRTPAGTLYKPDLTSFRDKLNHRIKYKYGHSIKYVLVGEYGLESDEPRPHYHGIVLGLPSSDRQLLYDCWGKGRIDISPVNHACIRYTLKYIDKQIFGFDSIYQAFGDYYPPFAFFSNGLGDRFYQENKDNFNELGEYYFSDTKKYKLNPYYQNKYGYIKASQRFGKDVIKYAKDNKINDLYIAEKELCKLREQSIISHDRKNGIPVYDLVKENFNNIKINVHNLSDLALEIIKKT